MLNVFYGSSRGGDAVGTIGEFSLEAFYIYSTENKNMSAEWLFSTELASVFYVYDHY